MQIDFGENAEIFIWCLAHNLNGQILSIQNAKILSKTIVFVFFGVPP